MMSAFTKSQTKVKGKTLAALVIVALSLIWISTIVILGIAYSAMPWCLTLGLMAVATIFSLPSKGLPQVVRSVKSSDHRPITFTEAYALTYILLSVALVLGIALNLLREPAHIVSKTQVVDIELTGLNDYKNNHEILPSSEEKTSLHKRISSDLQTRHGSLNVHSVQNKVNNQKLTVAQESIELSKKGNAQPSIRERSRLKSLASTEQLPSSREKYIVKLPFVQKIDASPTQPKANSSTKDLQASTASTSIIASQENVSFLEEMAPPELMELVDNDGTEKPDVWQAGGRSSGGTGKRAELVSYLKELNRRIKRKWSPPRGESRKTEVLFRIKKTGQLASLRILKSSGDTNCDEAAITAIAQSAPFHALPIDYSYNYLDVHYSFNYSVDELSEVTGNIIR